MAEQLARHGPPQRLRLLFFGWVFVSQLGHLMEHVSVALRGTALIGNAADSEETHLVFNTLVWLFAFALVWSFPRNPWVYPLAILSVVHGVEHAYIYEQYLRTGLVNGPGLLGSGGALGIVPLPRLDLHNVYNGFELIFIVLGFGHEIETTLSQEG